MSLLIKQYRPLSGKSKYLFVFLHGMNSNPKSLENLGLYFQSKFQDAHIILPQASFYEHKDFDAYRWFNKYSPEEEMLKEIKLSGQEVISCIEHITQQESIDYSRVILGGFSQGGMMSLHIAPRLEKQIGGIISFGGKVILPDAFESEIKSKPDALLIHGDQDNVVPYLELEESKRILEKYLSVESYTSKNVAHTINNDMLSEATKFIRKKLAQE